MNTVVIITTSFASDEAVVITSTGTKRTSRKTKELLRLYQLIRTERYFVTDKLVALCFKNGVIYTGFGVWKTE